MGQSWGDSGKHFSRLLHFRLKNYPKAARIGSNRESAWHRQGFEIERIWPYRESLLLHIFHSIRWVWPRGTENFIKHFHTRFCDDWIFFVHSYRIYSNCILVYLSYIILKYLHIETAQISYAPSCNQYITNDINQRVVQLQCNLWPSGFLAA